MWWWLIFRVQKAFSCSNPNLSKPGGRSKNSASCNCKWPICIYSCTQTRLTHQLLVNWIVQFFTYVSDFDVNSKMNSLVIFSHANTSFVNGLEKRTMLYSEKKKERNACDTGVQFETSGSRRENVEREIEIVHFEFKGMRDIDAGLGVNVSGNSPPFDCSRSVSVFVRWSTPERWFSSRFWHPVLSLCFTHVRRTARVHDRGLVIVPSLLAKRWRPFFRLF